MPPKVLLPETIRACLFDMDGVLTQTAKVHADAWKEMFDAFLQEREGESFQPFNIEQDYVAYVDGKLRQDGVQAFLASRGIELPMGSADDPPEMETINGLGNRKNELVVELIRTEGVQVYPGSIRFLQAVRAAGMPTAVVSASKNTPAVLSVTGLADQFDYVMHGGIAAEQGLAGKPAPDTFLAAAKALGVPAANCVVLEDALVGVAAGAAGGFGYVVGVNRADQRLALLQHGANVVVHDLDELIDGE